MTMERWDLVIAEPFISGGRAIYVRVSPPEVKLVGYAEGEVPEAAKAFWDAVQLLLRQNGADSTDAPQPIGTAPKNGTAIWGYHAHHGFAKMYWETGEACRRRYPQWDSSAEELGDVWNLLMAPDDDALFEPTHWLPIDALKEPLP